jgi:outer membrane protein OmpA-like peptidoglycan-associated protein
MNRTQSLALSVVVLAGCSSTPTAERDGNRYAFLDPATGVTYNVPLRFNLSTGLAALSRATASTPLEQYVAGTADGASTRREATTVALLTPLTRTNAVQDVPARTALVEAPQTTLPRPASVATTEAPAVSPSRTAPTVNLKLDTEFASAKRLVRFAFGVATLGPVGKRAVAELLPWAKQAERVNVQGGADSSGDAAKNRAIALARATAVSSAFIAGGVDREKISKNFCTDCYVAPNDTLEGRRMNRRVDVELVLKKELYAQLPAPVHAPNVPDSIPLIRTSALR